MGAIGLLLLKFGAKVKFLLVPILKFFPFILKTGGTMILTIGVYASMWGWKWAVGFVLLIFIHELGHLVSARKFGLNAGWPVFIPFMGAFIALKDAPKNAWIESWVGISGPLFGAAAALVCHSLGEMFDIPLLIGLAWSGYWLNLFNLIPIGQLDGGHVATALSPWLWVVGLGVMGWMAFQHPNFIIFIILAASLPRIFKLFRKRSPEEETFYQISSNQRWAMGSLYFALIGALVFGMGVAEHELKNRGIHHSSASTERVW